MMARSMPSAAGERQMLPRQTKSMRTGRSPMGGNGGRVTGFIVGGVW